MNYVMYADDICLMTPSPAALHELIIICYEPAGLTVHPPPPKMIKGGLIFLAWMSSATKILS